MGELCQSFSVVCRFFSLKKVQTTVARVLEQPATMLTSDIQFTAYHNRGVSEVMVKETCSFWKTHFVVKADILWQTL